MLEPASEHGKRGMDELHEQTINLLSFQQMPKDVFDTQVAFNVLDRYGPQFDSVSASRGEADARRLPANPGNDRAEVPSLLLLQAPIFHGHAFSLYIEMERPVARRKWRRRCPAIMSPWLARRKTLPATSTPQVKGEFWSSFGT